MPRQCAASSTESRAIPYSRILPSAFKRAEQPQRILEPGSAELLRRWAVKLVQVDMVGLQSPQRRFHGFSQIAGREIL